jgi:K(+)-stimulated pyrophosphate-energized sodium pump
MWGHGEPLKKWVGFRRRLSHIRHTTMKTKTNRFLVITVLFTIGLSFCASASEADIHIPDLSAVKFAGLGGITGHTLMMLGIGVCAVGALFGIVQYLQTKALPVHESMAKVSHTIYETCKTYLITQGKLLAILWVLIAACMVFYFGFLTEHKDATGQPLSSGHIAFNVFVILLASILGILGSYGVAWFGIRINTISNSRTAFSALKGNAFATLCIPLRSGMSIGLLLVAVELFFMICILMFLPRDLIGPCFIGFAIGESPHLRWHLHKDCGHRQRLDEDCFQIARRRSEESGRDRGLYRRQRGRLGRPDGGRI